MPKWQKSSFAINLFRGIYEEALKQEHDGVMDNGQRDLTDAERGDVIEMALSDKTPFETIKLIYGMKEGEVKKLMRQSLKAGSYRAWRKRVEKFRGQRAKYKS
jgi:TIGR03643 family protein